MGGPEQAETRTAFGTVLVAGEGTRTREPIGARSGVSGRVLAAGCALVATVIALVQLVSLPELLDVNRFLNAGSAKPVLLIFAVASVALVGAAAFLPRRLLHVPVVIAGGSAGLVVVATSIIGGEALPLAAAAVTMAACWVTGTWLLTALRVPVLAGMPPVAWLAGVGAIGLVLLLAGRGGLLRWWTVGAVVLVLGAIGLWRIVRGAPRASRAAWSAMTENRLASGCTALMAMLVGLAAIWAAAPETSFDALNSKGWLPGEWARTGEIPPGRVHPLLNFIGSGQSLAIPGHLFGADGVGRYLQWLSAGLVPAAVWWFLRPRTPWAPVAALAVAVTPLLFWEATTAYDDALLVLAGTAFAQATVALLERPHSPAWEGTALGVLAGAVLNMKLTLVGLVAGLLIAYLLLRGESRLRAGAGAAAGFLAMGGPPFAQRWIDLGNPIMPSYNNLFQSPYWPYINEKANLPLFTGGPIETLWRSVVDTSAVSSGSPVGGLGVLTLAVVAALIVGATALPNGRRGGSLVVLWGGLLVATVAWYVQFRLLRYLLPAGVIAVMFLGMAAGARRLSARAERAGLAMAAVLALLLWPSAVAHFWHVPGRDVPLAAAFGLEDDREYERDSTRERDVLAAFDSVSPPEARALTELHQRTWLTDGRDLTPMWELQLRQLQFRLDAGAGFPTTAEETLRRMRSFGVGWAIVRNQGRREPYLYWLYAVIARYGELRWADAGWAVYRLTERPRAPKPLRACDDELAGRAGCWQGELDGRPGYRADEDPVGITRYFRACPGETVTLDVRTEGGDGLLEVAIDFDGPDPELGHTRSDVAPDTTSRVGGTAPPDAESGRVVIARPPEGMTVSNIRLGRLGGCEGSNARRARDPR